MIKKKLLLLLTFFLLVLAVQAQISGGIKAGLNISTMSGDVSDVEMKPGFHLGGYINIGLNNKLSFQPEFLFSMAGAKAKFEDPGYSSEETTKFSYLSVPLSIQYAFGNFNVQAGPQVSFLLSAKNEFTRTITDGGNPVTESGESDVKENMKPLDLGLNLGVGFNFGKLGVSARYSLGIANTAKDEVEDYKTRNNIIQIGVMYKLFEK